MPLFEFDRELLPITSVTVAKIVCEEPFETEKLVWSEPTWPTSSWIFWMGQVSKKSKTTGIGLWPGPSNWGCRKELLETPLAEAKICVSPGIAALAVAWFVAKL